MTQEDLIFIESAKEIGRREADFHYAKLYALYVATVPGFMRPDNPTLESRPPGFNSDAANFVYFMDLGEFHANTFAVFEYRRAKSLWRFRHYVSQIQVGFSGFAVKQLISRTLPAAIMTSSEMWQEANKPNPEEQSQLAQMPALIQ